MYQNNLQLFDKGSIDTINHQLFISSQIKRHWLLRPFKLSYIYTLYNM